MERPGCDYFFENKITPLPCWFKVGSIPLKPASSSAQLGWTTSTTNNTLLISGHHEPRSAPTVANDPVRRACLSRFSQSNPCVTSSAASSCRRFSIAPILPWSPYISLPSMTCEVPFIAFIDLFIRSSQFICSTSQDLLLPLRFQLWPQSIFIPRRKLCGVRLSSSSASSPFFKKFPILYYFRVSRIDLASFALSS